MTVLVAELLLYSCCCTVHVRSSGRCMDHPRLVWAPSTYISVEPLSKEDLRFA